MIVLCAAMFPRRSASHDGNGRPGPVRGSAFTPPQANALSQIRFSVPVPKSSSTSSQWNGWFQSPRVSSAFSPPVVSLPSPSSGFASSLMPSLVPAGSGSRPQLVRTLGPLPQGDGTVVQDSSSPRGIQVKPKSSSLNPPVYNKIRGSKRVALETARDPARREAALSSYRRDQRSINDTSCFNLATWEEFHT